jgi:hypothetical protein
VLADPGLGTPLLVAVEVDVLGVGVVGVGDGVVGVGDGVVGVGDGVVGVGDGVVGFTDVGRVTGWLADAEGLGLLLLVALPGLVTSLLAWAAAAATELGPAGGAGSAGLLPLPVVLVPAGALPADLALL